MSKQREFRVVVKGDEPTYIRDGLIIFFDPVLVEELPKVLYHGTLEFYTKDFSLTNPPPTKAYKATCSWCGAWHIARVPKGQELSNPARCPNCGTTKAAMTFETYTGPVETTPGMYERALGEPFILPPEETNGQ